MAIKVKSACLKILNIFYVNINTVLASKKSLYYFLELSCVCLDVVRKIAGHVAHTTRCLLAEGQQTGATTMHLLQQQQQRFKQQ